MATSKRLNGLAQEATAAQTFATEPSGASAGEDITGFSDSGFKPSVCVIYLDKVTGASDLTVPAGAYVCGYDSVAAKWRRIGDLNSGNAITLSDDVGYEQRFVDIGSFQRIAVVAGDTGASTTYLWGVMPLETH